MSTVAVIMATYNGEKYLREQIESILNSSYQDFEIFIYDDGSTDNTLKLISEYEKLYPSKIHIHQNEKNLGVCINFLRAVSMTTMDYIMLCDQDDVWKPDKIAKTLKRMKNMESRFGKNLPLAVFTDADIVDENLNIINKSFFGYNHLDPSKTDLAHILMENKLIGCTVMINSSVRKLLHNYPLPINAKFHDWWIALITSSMGKIGYINERTLYYRQHSSNIVGGSGFFSYVKNRLANFGKQKEALICLYRQADEFLNIYSPILSPDSKKLISDFAHLDEMGFIKRRLLILKKGYLKTGLIRNIGLMIIA